MACSKRGAGALAFLSRLRGGARCWRCEARIAVGEAFWWVRWAVGVDWLPYCIRCFR